MSSPETASATLRGPSEIVVIASSVRRPCRRRLRRPRRRDRTRDAALRRRRGRLDEREDELALAALPANLERTGESAQQGDGRLVVAADGGDETRDPGRARVGGELVRKDRA